MRSYRYRICSFPAYAEHDNCIGTPDDDRPRWAGGGCTDKREPDSELAVHVSSYVARTAVTGLASHLLLRNIFPFDALSGHLETKGNN